MINVLLVEDRKMSRDCMTGYIKSSDRYQLAAHTQNAGMAEILCMQNKIDLHRQNYVQQGVDDGRHFRRRGCNNRTKNIKAQKVSETRCFLSFFTQKPQVKQSASVYPKWRLGRQTRFFHVLTQ